MKFMRITMAYSPNDYDYEANSKTTDANNTF